MASMPMPISPRIKMKQMPLSMQSYQLNRMQVEEAKATRKK